MQAMQQAGLSDVQMKAIAGGNCRQLLGLWIGQVPKARRSCEDNGCGTKPRRHGEMQAPRQTVRRPSSAQHSTCRGDCAWTEAGRFLFRPHHRIAASPLLPHAPSHVPARSRLPKPEATMIAIAQMGTSAPRPLVDQVRRAPARARWAGGPWSRMKPFQNRPAAAPSRRSTRTAPTSGFQLAIYETSQPANLDVQLPVQGAGRQGRSGGRNCRPPPRRRRLLRGARQCA